MDSVESTRSGCGGHLSLDLNLGGGCGGAVDSEHAEVEEKFPVEEETRRVEDIELELKRVTEENGELREMLQSVAWNYAALQSKILGATAASSGPRGGGGSPSTLSSPSPWPTTAANRKSGEVCLHTDYNSGGGCKPRVWKRSFRSDPKDSSLVVRDGYQWRKYGQKVTRDNPFPRAYFRCSFAPSCPVKKKVQRSKKDAWVVEATYEGEHNHGRGGDSSNHNSNSPDRVEVGRQRSAEEVARSLTEDPEFTAALAAAISRRMFSELEAPLVIKKK